MSNLNLIASISNWIKRPTSPSDKQVLQYNTATSTWDAVTIVEKAKMLDNGAGTTISISDIMLKSVYDTDGNAEVDIAETIDGGSF